MAAWTRLLCSSRSPHHCTLHVSPLLLLLLRLSPSFPLLSKLLSHYITTVLDNPKHLQPSLSFLLPYTLRSSSLTDTVARLLVQQLLPRLPLPSASALAGKWAEYFVYPLSMKDIWAGKGGEGRRRQEGHGQGEEEGWRGRRWW
jgi:hypothetical protein